MLRVTTLALSRSEGPSLATIPANQQFVRLGSEYIPQADKPERVLEILEFVRCYTPLTEEATKLDPRHIQYYSRAAWQLGLLSDDHELTHVGWMALRLETDERRFARLAIAFEASPIGRMWSYWSRRRFHEIDPQSAQQFLEEATDVSASTAERRAGTLRAWHVFLCRYHPARRNVPQPIARAPLRPLVPRSVFARGESLRVIEELAPGTHVLRVATAYFTELGYELVARGLTGTVINLLVGSDDAIPSVQEIIRVFADSVSAGPPTRRKRETLHRLHTEILQGVRAYEHSTRAKSHSSTERSISLMRMWRIRHRPT